MSGARSREHVFHGSQNQLDSTFIPRWSMKLFGPIARIGGLLLVGYPQESSWRKYEDAADWKHYHKVLVQKLENIAFVSGLLLAAAVSLLCSEPKTRITWTTTLAAIYGSIMSIIFCLICLWSLVGAHPERLRLLTSRTNLFFYLTSTPSLFGGGSALAFFIAVGAWVWLESGRNFVARLVTALMGGALVCNAALCFVLGASTY